MRKQKKEADCKPLCDNASFKVRHYIEDHILLHSSHGEFVQ